MVDFQMQKLHKPVMVQETIDHLRLKKGDLVLDCTVGLGGHAAQILQAIGPQGFLVGIDRDGDSLEIAKKNLNNFSRQCALIQKDFRFLDSVLDDLGMTQVDSILFDLGLSSYQLESSSRGFSIRLNGPLDMRMDQSTYISAYDLINSLSYKELSSILKNFGEERFYRNIANHLVRQRIKHPIESTEELKDIILNAIPQRYQHQSIHPATRSFQAFRIAVNRELEALDIALDKAMNYLRKDGTICVIAFHSLEDRIVKQKFRFFAKKDILKIITKKPLRPSRQEVDDNGRARSARLRVAQSCARST